jgi:hypothetical protein
MAQLSICGVGSFVNLMFAAGSHTPQEEDQVFGHLDV